MHEAVLIVRAVTDISQAVTVSKAQIDGSADQLTHVSGSVLTACRSCDAFMQASLEQTYKTSKAFTQEGRKGCSASQVNRVTVLQHHV